jgi:hypothetical protein
MPDVPESSPDVAAILGLLNQVAGTPSMRKMAEIKSLSAQHGFKAADTEALVAALTRVVVDAQARNKLAEAMEIVGQTMAAASEFGGEMVKVLEGSVAIGT